MAGTAKDEALNVAGTAAEQARNVVGEAKQQVTSQLSDQATTGRDKLSQTLRTLGDDLQQMAQGQGPSQGLATDLAQEVSDRVRAFGSHLENREPGQLLDDARDFARRRPGTFLAGRARRRRRGRADVPRDRRRCGRRVARRVRWHRQPRGGTTYGAAPPTRPTAPPVSGRARWARPAASAAAASRPDARARRVRHPVDRVPSGFDSTSSGLPGARTQDTP